MTVKPPVIDEKANRQNPTGVLKNLFCRKCNKSLTLRDLDVSRHVEGIVKCKKCGAVVLDDSKKKK